MLPEQDAANAVMQYAFKGGEMAIKITGAAAKNLALLLTAILQGKLRVKGKVNINTLIRQGVPLLSFPVPVDKLKEFCVLARDHGIKYSYLNDTATDKSAVSVDFFAAQNDVALLKTVFNKLNLGELPISGKIESKPLVRGALPFDKTPDEYVIDPELAESLERDTASSPTIRGRKEKDRPSAEESEKAPTNDEKTSVRARLLEIRQQQAAAAKTQDKTIPAPEKVPSPLTK
ncbi:MAG TPA: DUF3801 domain-containing protein [Clostridia bacterium]|nr:DUF3801 domain-containing protein [Clostridia bacterium]